MRWLGTAWAALRGRLRELRRAERRLLEEACGAARRGSPDPDEGTDRRSPVATHTGRPSVAGGAGSGDPRTAKDPRTAEGTEQSVLLTRSRVDVGQWLSRGRLWLAWTDGALLLFAMGKRPFVERLAAADLAESLYNPVTAELVLLPAATARQRTVRVAPVEGWNLLERIKRENREHA